MILMRGGGGGIDAFMGSFYAPVPLAGDTTALVRRTKKITDTQQDRRDGLVEHLRRHYFACVAYLLRIDDAWTTHMAYEWRCHCV